MTKRKLKKIVRVLGNSPEAIHATLFEAGIKGRAGIGRHCPVARYIRIQTGQAVDAGYQYIYVGEWRRGKRIRTPSALVDFMQAFDSGRYIDLRTIHG